jgi:hypothetical protein
MGRISIDPTRADGIFDAKDLNDAIQVASKILGVDQVIAAELLFRLGERAVGGRHLAVANAHGGRRLNRLQGFAADVVAGLFDPLGKREVLAHHGVGLVLRHGGPGLLVVVDEAQVAHEFPPGWMDNVVGN